VNAAAIGIPTMPSSSTTPSSMVATAPRMAAGSLGQAPPRWVAIAAIAACATRF